MIWWVRAVTLLTIGLAGYTFWSSPLGWMMGAWFVSPILMAAFAVELALFAQSSKRPGLAAVLRGGGLGAFIAGGGLSLFILVLWTWDIGEVRTGSSTSAVGLLLAPAWIYAAWGAGGLLGSVFGAGLHTRRRGRA